MSCTHLLCQRRRRVVDPLDPQSLVVLVDLDGTGLSQRHDKAVERNPSRRVHVDMLLVLNVLVVHGVRAHTLGVVTCLEERDKLVLELARELCNGRARVGSQSDDLAQMRFRPTVRLEAVLVSALLLTDLTVPPKPAEALGLDGI